MSPAVSPSFPSAALLFSLHLANCSAVCLPFCSLSFLCPFLVSFPPSQLVSVSLPVDVLASLRIFHTLHLFSCSFGCYPRPTICLSSSVLLLSLPFKCSPLPLTMCYILSLHSGTGLCCLGMTRDDFFGLFWPWLPLGWSTSCCSICMSQVSVGLMPVLQSIAPRCCFIFYALWISCPEAHNLSPLCSRWHK